MCDVDKREIARLEARIGKIAQSRHHPLRLSFLPLREHEVDFQTSLETFGEETIFQVRCRWKEWNVMHSYTQISSAASLEEFELTELYSEVRKALLEELSGHLYATFGRLAARV